MILKLFDQMIGFNSCYHGFGNLTLLVMKTVHHLDIMWLYVL